MTAGERNLRRQIKTETVRRPSLWRDGFLMAGYLLLRAVATLLTIYAGILWPLYVWLRVWPVDHHLAVQIWALVLGGWAFAGLVWSLGRSAE